MTASITTPAQIVNLALKRIGFKGTVGSLFDGSAWSKAALTIYAQTRDELIRNGEWQFAERVIGGTLLKTAPPGGYAATPWTSAYPAPPWRYEYSYPVDCLDVRSVRTAPAVLPNFDPVFNRFSVENDNGYSPAVKVILCDVPNAIITYAGQITDPSTWEPDFVEAMAASLGRRLAPELVGLDSVKLAAADEQSSDQLANNRQG